MTFAAVLARLRAFFVDVRSFISPFHDPRAWTLIAICGIVEWLIAPAAALTIWQWLINFGLFGGFAVIVSRHVLPQIKLTAAVETAMKDNPVAAGLLVLSVAIFMSALVISLTLWAKA